MVYIPKHSREEIGDDQRPGRPNTLKTVANVGKVAQIFQQNRRLSICADDEIINIDKETLRQILHNNSNMKMCNFDYCFPVHFDKYIVQGSNFMHILLLIKVQNQS
jgi:hypothetical protein